MSHIDYEMITKHFIMDGFFSEYLPPSFSLENSFDPCTVPMAEKAELVSPLMFTMSRFSEDGKRRAIYIPEFSGYLSTVKFMRENDLIKDIIQESADEHSFSPLIQTDGNLTRHEQCYYFDITADESDQESFNSTYIPNIVDKLNRAKGACGILSLDISNFYASIYTHLIPCIKLGYENAEIQYKAKKANNSDPCITEAYRTYSNLDEHIRNLNNARTNGLLPGTLISQFIAEALLSKVDEEIQEHGIQFVRYVDDYEIFIYDEAKINEIQSTIMMILSKYSLSLNNEKTKYTAFPYYVIENLEEIFMNFFRSNPSDAEIMKLFNTYFKLEGTGTKGAIRFLIKSINDSFIPFNNNLLLSYLFDVLANDSRSLVKVCQLLIRRKSQSTIDGSDLLMIENLLKKHLQAGNHLEAVWLLYLRRKISRKKISAEILHTVARSDNDLAKIIIIEECCQSRVSEKLKKEIIQSESSWLLCYQLFYNDWISKDQFLKLSHITKNAAFYATLKRKNFSFYKA